MHKHLQDISKYNLSIVNCRKGSCYSLTVALNSSPDLDCFRRPRHLWRRLFCFLSQNVMFKLLWVVETTDRLLAAWGGVGWHSLWRCCSELWYRMPWPSASDLYKNAQSFSSHLLIWKSFKWQWNCFSVTWSCAAWASQSWTLHMFAKVITLGQRPCLIHVVSDQVCKLCQGHMFISYYPLLDLFNVSNSSSPGARCSWSKCCQGCWDHEVQQQSLAPLQQLLECEEKRVCDACVLADPRSLYISQQCVNQEWYMKQ